MIEKPVKFVPLTLNGYERLAIASYGNPGAGKSRFAGTFPSPIGVVALDRKSKFSIGKAAEEFGKELLIPDVELVRISNPMRLAMMDDSCGRRESPKFGSPEPTCCSSHFYRWHVNRIKEVAFTLAEMPDSKCRSIVIDSASQLAEDVLYANYGRTLKIMPRDRGAYNQEMREFLNAISSKHVLLTHQAKEVWVNEQPTGRFRRKGWTEIGYNVNVEIEHYRASKRDAVDGIVEGEFLVDVTMSQTNPSLHGEAGARLLFGEAITFQNLALKVVEGSQPEDWE
jgi:hypothetical protein